LIYEVEKRIDNERAAMAVAGGNERGRKIIANQCDVGDVRAVGDSQYAASTGGIVETGA
jgi:hypothetical protein